MVSRVIDNPPTPEEARAALAEASNQATLVRRADHEFQWILLIIAATYLSVAAILSVSPHHGTTFSGIATLVIAAAAVIGLVWRGVRLRAFTHAGFLGYMFAIAAFSVWNGLAVGVSVATRYWASNQPSYHFGVTALIGIIPLIGAAFIIRRR
jgi:hypothetical protein